MTQFQIKLIDYLVIMVFLAIITIIALQIPGQYAGYAAMFGFGATLYVVFKTIGLLIEDHEDHLMNQDEQKLQDAYDYEQSLQNPDWRHK